MKERTSVYLLIGCFVLMTGIFVYTMFQSETLVQDQGGNHYVSLKERWSTMTIGQKLFEFAILPMPVITFSFALWALIRWVIRKLKGEKPEVVNE